MKLIEKDQNQLVFEAETSESLANAIRRYINQIPALAIDELEISRNDSPLYDETIAHRVGLVPVKMDKSGEKNKLKLSVKKEGTVYSGDMKGKTDIIYKNIPLTTLDKGQELEFTAALKIGKGSEHSKFSPGLMFYRHASEITMDRDFLEEIRELLPETDIKEKGNKIVIMDNKKKEIIDVCEGILHKKKKKAEVNAGKELIIKVESFGQMDPKDIFKESINTLKKDLSEISKKIDKA